MRAGVADLRRASRAASACYTFHRTAVTAEDCIDKRFIRTNDRIRAREIRVIDDEGNQLGIMPPYEALKIAREKTLDLVEVSPTAQPPVCRIMDYGKYLYQQEKREREAKKHQHQITVKEVKFRINVDDHDYETKKNHVLRFLGEGDKVKATIFFRGREMTRQSLGRGILDRLDPGFRRQGDRGVSAAAGRQHPAPDPGAAEGAGAGEAAKRAKPPQQSQSKSCCSAGRRSSAATATAAVVNLAGFVDPCKDSNQSCRRIARRDG